MKDIIREFEDLPAIIEKIDSIMEEAGHTRKKVEKRQLLTQAQNLADAYQEHCEAGGNDKKQFNQLL